MEKINKGRQIKRESLKMRNKKTKKKTDSFFAHIFYLFNSCFPLEVWVEIPSHYEPEEGWVSQRLKSSDYKDRK